MRNSESGGQTSDDRMDEVIAAVIEILQTDPVIRIAIVQGRKADLTIYFHRGEVARPPQIVFHPVA